MTPMLLVVLGCRSPDPAASPIDTDTWDPDAPLSERCFGGLGDAADGAVPEYDAFGPVVPRHCSGTDHQDIEGVQKVVFLGDSITTGTPPTPSGAVYRALLSAMLVERFGEIEIADCSAWGGEVGDLLEDDDQILRCLPDPVTEERVLLVMTNGGNDLFAAAQELLDGGDAAAVDARVDQTLDQLSTALHWLRDEQPTRFPAGLDLVYANLYEYTDGTGDLSLCPSAGLLGFEGQVPAVRDAYVRANEAYVQLAVETGFDVVFLLEHFCGHGYLAGDPDNECYRGADAENWFDASCIHPNPVGHQQIARMFMDVIEH